MRPRVAKISRRAVLAFLPTVLAQRSWAASLRQQVLLIAESNAATNQQIPLNQVFRQVLDYVEKELHLQFETRRYPWKRLMQSVNEGEGLAFGLSKTKERTQTLEFSIPAFATYVWMVCRSDQVFNYSRLSDLQGKTIGVVRGSSYGVEFDSAKPSLMIEEDIYSLPSRLKKLLSKRMDVMLITHDDPDPRKVEALVNKTMAEAVPETSMPEGITFKVINRPLAIDYIHFAIQHNKDHQLMVQIDRALKKAQQEGILPTIAPPRNN